MLEELNLLEMSEVLGGAYDYCNGLQEIANKYGDGWSDSDWDKWADSYLASCG